MSAAEKITWLKVLVAEWGLFLFFALFVSLAGTDLGRTTGVWAIAWIAIGFTLLYLLILSWRAAYLAGKSNR